MADTFLRRRAGVLLHPTSLPGGGTLGEDAFRFVDFLCDGGFSVWQTLPLGPVDIHGSPYCPRSESAGNVSLIDEHRLAKLDELPRGMAFSAVHIEPTEAWLSFKGLATASQKQAFVAYAHRHRKRLFAHGLFELCREQRGGAPWWEWPEDWRDRQSGSLRQLLAKHRERFRSISFQQYLFDLQWSSLKRYANERGILVFGDVPFYMDHNSVEVWARRDLFRLDQQGAPLAVAGVPPDYFNEEGQLWGNPLYDWDAMRADGFRWWVQRFANQFERFDLVRIDHFRAFESYWEVAADAQTAKEGVWRQGAGAELFCVLVRELPHAQLVAEDLGIITDEVRTLRDQFGLPGMAVLQFAFDGTDDNPHLPANHLPHSVCYTGTHDNDTSVGWFHAQDDEARARIAVGLDVDELRIPDDLIEAAYGSPAQLTIIPMQDLLGCGSHARMNTPGMKEGNWAWRFRWADVDPDIAVASRDRAERYGRFTASAYS